MRNKQSTHDQCLELLPWFVNGSLATEQRAMVERHAGECGECAAELQSQLQLQAALRESDSVMLAPQASWQKMAERIELEEERREGVPRSRARNYGWQLVAATQAAIIAGLVLALWWSAQPLQVPNDNSPTAAPRYETLTSDVDVPIASRASGAEFRVVFQRDVPIVEINQLLQTLPAQIVSGPTEAGVYLLALPPDRGAVAGELLTRLRSDRRIVFAEHLNLIEYHP